MSFILDALRKSEAERKRHDTPGIASIPESRPRERNLRWQWIVGGLLLVNFIAVVGLMLDTDDAPPVEPVAALKATTEQSAPETFSEIVRAAKQSTPQAAETSTGEDQAESPPPALPVTRAQKPTVEALPTFDQLRVDGILQLPDLHLDIHVYSGQPANRFVFVNMSKYKEGSTLAEGPTVREIAPDGVILEYRGRRFLLPRE